MATVSKRQVGIEARRQTKQGRYYDIVPNDPFASVTNILGIVNKPALIPWAAKMERIMVVQAAKELYKEGVAQGLTEDAYITILEARIGKQRASQRELEAAGEIGSQAHAMIEWTLRKAMGQQVGPQPKICDAAQWAFMAYEDWAKKVALRPIRIEQVVYSMQHKYAGTMDLLAWVADANDLAHKTLIDFKTGKAIYAEAYLQTAAYRRAIMEMGLDDVEAGMIVRLPKVESDPKFEAVEVPDLEGNFRAFLAALDLWRWQQEREVEYRAKIEALKEAS